MDYKEFEKYNNRSKAMLGKDKLVYIEDVALLQKKYVADKYELQNMLGIFCDDRKLPTKAYVCIMKELANYWSGSAVTLLSSVLMRVIAGEIWVVNPEILSVEGILKNAELLPTYTPIETCYDDEERVLDIKIDNLVVASCGFSELMGENAAYEILEKTLKNLRAYGVITNRIEGRLSDIIEEALVSENIRHFREIGIGAIK